MDYGGLDMEHTYTKTNYGAQQNCWVFIQTEPSCTKMATNGVVLCTVLFESDILYLGMGCYDTNELSKTTDYDKKSPPSLRTVSWPHQGLKS